MAHKRNELFAEHSVKMTKQLETMGDNEILNLVNKQLESMNKDKEADPLKSAARDAEMRSIEEALTRRVLDKLYALPYGYGYDYPVQYDVITGLRSIQQYHDLILGYEYANAIAGYTYPLYADVAFALGLLIDENGHFKTDTLRNYKEQHRPKETAKVQLGEQGVPVLVDPVLIKNKMTEEDLE